MSKNESKWVAAKPEDGMHFDAEHLEWPRLKLPNGNVISYTELVEGLRKMGSILVEKKQNFPVTPEFLSAFSHDLLDPLEEVWMLPNGHSMVVRSIQWLTYRRHDGTVRATTRKLVEVL